MMGIIILMSMVVCGTLYLNILSFFPLYVDKRFNGAIPTQTIAFMLCSFNAAGVLFSPCNYYFIRKYGRKNSLMFGFFLLFISQFALGIFADVPDKYPSHFVLVNSISRFVQGWGDSLAMASSMNLISHNFPDDH
jgi:MFS family permease